MAVAIESIVKDFQSNLLSFVNSFQNLSISIQNIAKMMTSMDPSPMVNRSAPALIDWGQNLLVLTERFETDIVNQLPTNIEKESLTSEATRIIMLNMYEKVLFFLNHMSHSYIDYSRSESPSYVDSVTNVPLPNPAMLQRFRMMQQQQNRRWSEVNTSEVNTESNIDSNRRWSMPTNVTQARFIPTMNKLAGILNPQASQSTIPDSTLHSSITKDGVIEAIQLLSFRPLSQRQSHSGQQQPHNFRQQQQRQSRQRGELNEILILPSLTCWPRYQQIVENIRGESDEY